MQLQGSDLQQHKRAGQTLLAHLRLGPDQIPRVSGHDPQVLLSAQLILQFFNDFTLDVLKLNEHYICASIKIVRLRRAWVHLACAQESCLWLFEGCGINFVNGCSDLTLGYKYGWRSKEIF